MDELLAKTPCAGLLPVVVGPCRLSETALWPLATIAPYSGRQEAVSEKMLKAHGIGFPAPNASVLAGDVRAIWFGRDVALLAGVAPDAGLAGDAALTDQSDAWAAVTLSGSGAEQVLARLVPVDLRVGSFGVDATCRTLLGHMTASITRVGEDAFLIFVFRSMAQTLVEDLHEAMEAVAARG